MSLCHSTEGNVDIFESEGAKHTVFVLIIAHTYKRAVKQFRGLQTKARVPFVYDYIKAYVVGSHLNCIDLSMQLK